MSPCMEWLHISRMQRLEKLQDIPIPHKLTMLSLVAVPKYIDLEFMCQQHPLVNF